MLRKFLMKKKVKSNRKLKNNHRDNLENISKMMEE